MEAFIKIFNLETLLSLIAIFISIWVYIANKENERKKIMPMFEIVLTKENIFSNRRLNIRKSIQLNSKSSTSLFPNKIDQGYYRQKIKVKFSNRGNNIAFNTRLISLRMVTLALGKLDIDLKIEKDRIIKITKENEEVFLDLYISIKDFDYYDKLKDLELEEIKKMVGGMQVNLIGSIEFYDLHFNKYIQDFNIKDIEFFHWDCELETYNIEYLVPPLHLNFIRDIKTKKLKDCLKNQNVSTEYP